VQPSSETKNWLVFLSADGGTGWPASLAMPEAMRMAKNVKVTGQEQNNKNNQDACGDENPLVFIGHVLKV
jgi:hypothetical protein